VIACAALAVLVVPSPQHAIAAVDLTKDANILITGGSSLGLNVADAGDVNGDGRDDILVGAPYAGSAGNPGAAFVVYGKSTSSTIDLSQTVTSSAGFEVVGSGSEHLVDASANPAGYGKG
jgi:hypothetical protein